MFGLSVVLSALLTAPIAEGIRAEPAAKATVLLNGGERGQEFLVWSAGTAVTLTGAGPQHWTVSLSAVFNKKNRKSGPPPVVRWTLDGGAEQAVMLPAKPILTRTSKRQPLWVFTAEQFLEVDLPEGAHTVRLSLSSKTAEFLAVRVVVENAPAPAASADVATSEPPLLDRPPTQSEVTVQPEPEKAEVVAVSPAAEPATEVVASSEPSVQKEDVQPQPNKTIDQAEVPAPVAVVETPATSVAASSGSFALGATFVLWIPESFSRAGIGAVGDFYGSLGSLLNGARVGAEIGFLSLRQTQKFVASQRDDTTNELRTSANLLPIMAVAAMSYDLPFHARLDVGAGPGMSLMWLRSEVGSSQIRSGAVVSPLLHAAVGVTYPVNAAEIFLRLRGVMGLSRDSEVGDDLGPGGAWVLLGAHYLL